MKSIVLTVDQWSRIRTELQTEYPRTVFMLRNKMRSVLGFTVREHKYFADKPDGGYYEFQIHLDFYSANKRTMFMLKFSEILGNIDGKL
jgi:hypothetical protein